MNLKEVIVDGKTIQLGKLIGRGGEGNVYGVVGNDNQAIKVYTTSDRLTRESKVAAIVRSGLSTKSPLVAFPSAVVRSRDGSFAGFVMRLITGCRPLHELYAPGSRKQHFPQADYRFVARAASNIARAFASVHSLGCVVGDINHSGVLVSGNATAVLIDADSFQISNNGTQYLCAVGVPEYTPPELQGRSLVGVVRTADHDAFGLAVVMFQVLMMGRHPFVGTVRKGEIPPLHENIANFRYVYTDSRNVGMDQPPGTPNLADFSPEIAALFDRAFSKEGVGKRPRAADWVAALEKFEASLVQCDDNPLHHIPKDASECPWCDMEQQVGTVLFLPYRHDPLGSAAAKVGVGSDVDVDAIWVRIQRITVPTRDQLKPVLRSSSFGASPRALAAVPKAAKRNVVGGVLLLLLAVGLFVAAPGAGFFSLIIAGFGVFQFKEPEAPKVNGESFKKEYIDAQQAYERDLEAWYLRLGFVDLERQRSNLSAAHRSYHDAKGSEQRLVAEYREHRYSRQLESYLEGFDLARASIKGIGPAKLATLASYGVDTAADLTSARLDGVPGFGDVTNGRLLEWRRKHEARFVYNTRENNADKQELARLSAVADAQAAPHRQALVTGLQGLEQRCHHIRHLATQPDAALQRAHDRVAQARADLAHLGLPTPATPPSPSAARAPTPGTFRTPAPSPAPAIRPVFVPPSVARNQQGVPDCPRCTTPMVRRLANRGRNRGHYFWGCTRYPGCRGTRPI